MNHSIQVVKEGENRNRRQVPFQRLYGSIKRGAAENAMRLFLAATEPGDLNKAGDFEGFFFVERGGKEGGDEYLWFFFLLHGEKGA